MTHRQTVVFQWAEATPLSSDLFGTVIKKLRTRIDMVHRFPNKRFMYEYLTTRCKLDEQKVETVIDALWSSYYAFNRHISNSQRETA